MRVTLAGDPRMVYWGCKSQSGEEQSSHGMQREIKPPGRRQIIPRGNTHKENALEGSQTTGLRVAAALQATIAEKTLTQSRRVGWVYDSSESHHQRHNL